MKKIMSVVLLGLILVSALNAQKNVIDEVFKKYAKIESATVVNINGLLLKFAAKHDEELNQLNISDIKVLTIEDPEDNKGINFYNEIVPDLLMGDYKELVRVTEKDEKVIMLVKEEGNRILEFLVVVGGVENTLVRIQGDLNRDNFEELAGIADVDVHFD